MFLCYFLCFASCVMVEVCTSAVLPGFCSPFLVGLSSHFLFSLFPPLWLPASPWLVSPVSCSPFKFIFPSCSGSLLCAFVPAFPWIFHHFQDCSCTSCFGLSFCLHLPGFVWLHWTCYLVLPLTWGQNHWNYLWVTCTTLNPLTAVPAFRFKFLISSVSAAICERFSVMFSIACVMSLSCTTVMFAFSACFQKWLPQEQRTSRWWVISFQFLIFLSLSMEAIIDF